MRLSLRFFGASVINNAEACYYNLVTNRVSMRYVSGSNAVLAGSALVIVPCLKNLCRGSRLSFVDGANNALQTPSVNCVTPYYFFFPTALDDVTATKHLQPSFTEHSLVQPFMLVSK
jgi:hypothetical protein